MEKLKLINIIIIIKLFIASELVSQVSEPNIVSAYRISTDIELDGKLDEAPWYIAQRITNFTQRELYEGSPVTERTECAVLYDNENLYIGFWCYDSEPDKLTARYMKKDFPYWEEDNFEVIFDTFDDDRNGYVFVVNPNGARSDVLVLDEGKGFNIDWDGIWDASVTRNENGWFGEMRIPFSTLKFPDTKVQVWGVNFERNIRRKQEQVFWQGWSRDYDFEHVSHAGTLIGISGISPDKTIEFKPYSLIGADAAPGTKTSMVTKAGGDLNYLVTPTLKLNLTANTDFAQVEADRERINLTRFSLFYPEKREFFLEGKNFFEFRMNDDVRLFYSRRIGIENNMEIPVIGGARLMGTADDTNIGIMTLQTSARDNIPTKNHSVVRFRQNILEKSNIGIIFTGQNSHDNYNYLLGSDFMYSVSDWFGDKNFVLKGAFAGTIDKSIEEQDNYSYNLVASYPNNEVDASIAYQEMGNNFNPALGFVRRAGYRLFSSNFGLLPHPEFISWIEQFDFELYDINAYYTRSNGKLESMDLSIRPLGIRTSGGDVFTINMIRLFERIDERFELYRDNFIEPGNYWYSRISFRFSSYAGRNMSLGAGLSTGEFFNGYRTIYSGSMFMNLGKHINLFGDYEYNVVTLDDGSFNAHELAGRLEFSFSPKMFTSTYAQWNSRSSEMLINFRIHWIPQIGSDFYLALNHYLETCCGIRSGDTVILAKLAWRIPV